MYPLAAQIVATLCLCNGRRLIISILVLPTSIWGAGGGAGAGAHIEPTEKQSMLNALLNLLLFYNKIYAQRVVVLAAGKRYAERARKRERER